MRSRLATILAILLSTSAWSAPAHAATKAPTVTGSGPVVSTTVVPDEPATMSVTAGATTFRLDIPDGAVLQPLTLTMRAGRTSTGQPAVLLEPSGWVLLRPATLTITGARPRALWSWGPAAHPRALRTAAGSGSDTRVVIGLGAIAGSTSSAVPSASADTAEERFVRTEEEDEAKRPDGEVDASRAQALVAKARNPKPCRKGDRAAAAAALQAARLATAVTGSAVPVPSCVAVHLKVFTDLEATGSFGTPVDVEERMSSEGDLQPTDSGHEGSLPVTAELAGAAQTSSRFLTTLGKVIADGMGIEAPPPSDDKCSTSAPYGGRLDATITWSGGDTARLRLDPTPPKYDWSCGKLNGTSDLGAWGMVRVMLGLGETAPIELDVSVLQGSVRVISSLDQAESQTVRTSRKGAGTQFEVTVETLTVRVLLSIEVSYTMA